MSHKQATIQGTIQMTDIDLPLHDRGEEFRLLRASMLRRT
jgi:hypothetical protein